MKHNIILVTLGFALALLSTLFLTKNETSLNLAKANVDALASIPAESCYAGGPESYACSSYIDIETEPGNVYHYGCEITCPTDTYSCCNIVDCKCVSY